MLYLEENPLRIVRKQFFVVPDIPVLSFLSDRNVQCEELIWNFFHKELPLEIIISG